MTKTQLRQKVKSMKPGIPKMIDKKLETIILSGSID